MRKTKIICTLGPASEDDETITELMKAGMNVARFNFSHGSHEEHKAKFEKVIRLRHELDLPVATLLDTKGPEIRLRDFENGSVELKEGQRFTLTTDEVMGNEERVSVSYKEMTQDVIPGGTVLIDDGLVALNVLEINGPDIVCEVMNGGVISNKKGVNIPNIDLSMPFISEKDRDDLIFGCEMGFEYCAASFTRTAQDILDIRKIFDEHGGHMKIIAKIESMQGVKNVDEILDVADGIMVARGDLGVEVPAEDVPLIQKSIIKKCNAAGKIVITATQMLESMQENPRPTRAEVSDVANAIYDGTDAIMLSGESAQGKYPEEAVLTMNKIAHKIEENLDYASILRRAIRTADNTNPSEAICMSVAEIAANFNVSAIIAFTETGATAKRMSRYRPHCPIIAPTPSDDTVKKLALNWGVKPVLCKSMKSREGLMDLAMVIAKENGISAGEQVIVTGGTPGVSGLTSYLEIVTIK